MNTHISVRRASLHNLKNVSVEFPAGALTVVSGPSGSGKTSLVFDTLYREARRRVLQILDPGAYLPQQAEVEGVSFALAFEASAARRGAPHVAALSGVLAPLRTLLVEKGQRHCTNCDALIAVSSPGEIAESILSLPENTKIILVSGEDTANTFLRAGLTRGWKDGSLLRLEELEPEFVVSAALDSFSTKPSHAKRIREACDLARRLGSATLSAVVGAEIKTFSLLSSCLSCGTSQEPVSLRSFSGGVGGCPGCEGKGEILLLDEEKIAREGAAPRLLGRPLPSGASLSDELLTRAARSRQAVRRELILSYFRSQQCPLCVGSGLTREAGRTELFGRRGDEIFCSSISELVPWASDIAFDDPLMRRLSRLLRFRINTLDALGLGYLHLSRRTRTLSSGEFLRTRLSRFFSASVEGVLYLLDEPTRGLHPKDIERLVAHLREQCRDGNTVITIEHDEEFQRRADWLVQLGPGGGSEGGQVVSSGPPDQSPVPYETTEPKSSLSSLILEDITVHNLQIPRLELPLGVITVICGVSGSGKSSLALSALAPAITHVLEGGSSESPIPGVGRVQGTESIREVVGAEELLRLRTSRSTVATLLGVYTPLRELFASGSEARLLGLSAKNFSFTTAHGWCPTCQGKGVLTVRYGKVQEEIACHGCGGLRVRRDVAEVQWKGISFAQALQMTLSEAEARFARIPMLISRIRRASSLGLGYLSLAHASARLSGGELQRLRLLRYASGSDRLLIFDEPSVGLHRDEVKKLYALFQELRENGNTVVVVDHHLQLIALADHVIELGPGAGEKGGRIIAKGAPGEIISSQHSQSASFLAK